MPWPPRGRCRGSSRRWPRPYPRAGRSLDDELPAPGLEHDLLHAVDRCRVHLVEIRIAQQDLEPVTDQAGVAGADDDAPQRRPPGPMRGLHLAGMKPVRDAPLDHERDRAGLGTCVDVLGSPPQYLAVGALPRAFDDRRQVPARALKPGAHRIEVLRAQRPGDKPPAFLQGPRDAPAEPARGGLTLVDDRDQLELLPAERHDDVGGSGSGVPAAGNSLQAETFLQVPGAILEVGHRQQDVIHDGRRVEAPGGLREVRHRTSSPPPRNGGYQPPYATHPPSTVTWLPVM